MTFSRQPNFIKVQDGNTLCQNVKSVLNTGVGYDTNLEAAFDKILDTCIKNNISKEDMKEYMIKTLNEENNGIQISDLNVDEIYASLSTNSKLADNSLNKIESTASSSSGKRVYAQNYFYVKEEGGLDKVVSVNYKYKMVINDKTYNVRIFSLESTTQVFPGDNSMVVFEAEEDIERNDGDRYELYLGDKKVGKGLVSD